MLVFVVSCATSQCFVFFIMNATLRVFVSSTMVDLAEERAAARDAIAKLRLEPVLVEGVGASSSSPQDATLSLVTGADIYIGIFWKRYGSVSPAGLSATEMEYQRARAEGKPILVYEKKPAPQREPLLGRFLKEIEQYDSGHLRATFGDAKELSSRLQTDLMNTIFKLAKAGQQAIRDESEPRVSSPEPAPPDLFEFQGVLDLLRDRVVRRVVEQLDPSVKRFKTMQAVEEGVDRLVTQIDAAGFQPEQVIGWRDAGSAYRGSEVTSELLAKRLKIPFKLIELDEVGERRSVVSDCRWFGGMSRVLVVDDACYSGNTLKSIHRTLLAVEPSTDIRFAVLSKNPRVSIERVYSAAEHSTGELLFPWGWSRHIVGLYDIFRLFGISDRRVVVRDTFSWGTTDVLAKAFVGSIAVQQILKSGVIDRHESDADDVFLYVAGGHVSVSIGSTQGEFSAGEYLFLPRGVGFKIAAITDSTIIRLTTAPEQRDRDAVRLALSRGSVGV